MHETGEAGVDFSELIGHHLADHHLWSAAAGFGFTKQMLWMTIAAVLTAVPLLIAAARPGKLRGIFDFFILFIREDIVRPALGGDTDFYLPYFLTLFLFIFLMNVMGLIPFGMTPTGNLSVTIALSLTTFFLVQGSGIVRHGFFKHYGNLIPHELYHLNILVAAIVIPMVFLIEFMGYFVKSTALCIRLFANMTAGHLVILLFLGLILLFGKSNPGAGFVVAPISVGLTLGLYMLELIVALVQAYVFTLLTAIFVGGALHPSH